MDSLDTKLEKQELDETEYALRNRIQNAESELGKMKEWATTLRYDISTWCSYTDRAGFY